MFGNKKSQQLLLPAPTVMLGVFALGAAAAWGALKVRLLWKDSRPEPTIHNNPKLTKRDVEAIERQDWEGPSPQAMPALAV